MYEHNALGYWSGLTLCLTKVRSSRARCPATALILHKVTSTLFVCHTSLVFRTTGDSETFLKCPILFVSKGHK